MINLEKARAILSAAKVANQDANKEYAVAIGGPNECDEWNNCIRTAKLVEQYEYALDDLEEFDMERRTLLRAQEAYAEAIERPAKVACVGLSQTLETRIRQLEAAE